MITYHWRGHTFNCYTAQEMAELGLTKTHKAVSRTFVPSEADLLAKWIGNFEGAILVTNARPLPRITVWAPGQRPKKGERYKGGKPNSYKRCGEGQSRFEGQEGCSDNRALYDVLNACTRKLREWERQGILNPGAPSFTEHATALD